MIFASRLIGIAVLSTALISCGGGGGTGSPGGSSDNGNSSGGGSGGSAVVVSVNPASPSILSTNTQKFTARVSNETDQTVTWSVEEANGGTIDQTGLYTPPQTTGFYHVKAVSNADSSVSGTAVANVIVPSGTGTVGVN
jgi:hypothetical protein